MASRDPAPRAPGRHRTRPGWGPSRRRPGGLVAAALLVCLVAPSCRTGSPASAGCDRPVAEPLDRRSFQHVLPGATGVSYLSDPPTSGAHQPTPRVPRRNPRPLARPIQVGVLETGDVLVQHRGLSVADRRRVEALAGGRVVVAPALGELGGHRVVATAWLAKLTCDRASTAAIEAFARDHSGQGPGAGG